ncbi:MAG: DUF116 domain-containing protein [Veillonellales bacterium]
MDWRLINSGCRSAAENSALAKTILNTSALEHTGGSLRFFRFDSSYVLVGQYQDVEREVRGNYCREQGIQVVRRLTGGGVAYVDRNTLAWEIIAAKNDLPAYPSEELTRMAGDAAAEGLRKLGLAASYHEPGEIRLAGRLLCRIHCLETAGSMLWEGYIPLELDAGVLLRVLRIPTEKLTQKAEEAFKTRHTSLAREYKGIVSAHQVRQVLAEAVTKRFGVSFYRCRQREEPAYLSPFDWCGENPVCDRDSSKYRLCSRLRCQGRELTAALVLDDTGQRIESARITGDFYLYPGSAVTRLTKKLAGLPANEESVDPVVAAELAFVRITGFTVENFRDTIREALSKKKFTGIGASPQEVSDLYCVGGLKPNTLPELLQTRPLTFLLPYCAKQPDCKFRFIEGCGCCGRCDVGDGYRLAEQNRLQPLTIQNYEMLEDALRAMKAAGKRIFFGTCCEEFIDKHYQDFKKIGLPGLLVGVNNSTCYELGKDAEAHQGTFEKQTKLKMDLIKRIIKCSA